jgi:hypothetical protein
VKILILLLGALVLNLAPSASFASKFANPALRSQLSVSFPETSSSTPFEVTPSFAS